jgi:hypothetical protein
MEGHDPKTGRFIKGYKGGPGRPLGSRDKYRSGKRLRKPRHLIPYHERFRSILNGIVSDLGGDDNMSTGQLQVARRCATLSAHCEMMEEKALYDPEAFDFAGYGALTDKLGRAFERLGLERKQRDVTSLQQYLNTRREPVLIEGEPAK